MRPTARERPRNTTPTFRNRSVLGGFPGGGNGGGGDGIPGGMAIPGGSWGGYDEDCRGIPPARGGPCQGISLPRAVGVIGEGADVHAVMTGAARGILHPNALEFATGHPVVTELDGSMSYLEMCGKGGRADLLLIAPATSNTVGKIAHGIDHTTVTTYAVNALGAGIPLILAPAAHATMLDNPLVQANLPRLLFLPPDLLQPKREEDKAKMADADAIVARVIRRLGPRDLAGRRVVVVAGGTSEPIDDVRIVTNRSTGATGIELAKAAFEHGADVEVWIGRHEVPVPTWIPARAFDTTADLAKLAGKAQPDIAMVPAAIADFAPRPRKGKIPSREGAPGPPPP